MDALNVTTTGMSPEEIDEAVVAVYGLGLMKRTMPDNIYIDGASVPKKSADKFISMATAATAKLKEVLNDPAALALPAGLQPRILHTKNGTYRPVLLILSYYAGLQARATYTSHGRGPGRAGAARSSKGATRPANTVKVQHGASERAAKHRGACAPKHKPPQLWYRSEPDLSEPDMSEDGFMEYIGGLCEDCERGHQV